MYMYRNSLSLCHVCLCSSQDNKVNGVMKTTRCIGNSYLFPYVIPDPHVTSVSLRHDDEFLIIANRGLWRYDLILFPVIDSNMKP